MIAIETKDLTRKFGNLTAVDNVNLKVDQGEIFGLLGPTAPVKAHSFLCYVLY